MRVLVSGGAGFIGSNLCERLLKEGYAVIAVDNLITGSDKNVRYLSKYPKFTFLKHDITKPFTSVNRKLLTVDLIYHLACPTGVDNLIPLALEMILACSVGTQNVLDLARKNKAKFLFTSSSEVYGDPKVFPQRENYNGNVDPTGVRSPYEEGKRFSESLVSVYVRKHNVDAKIVRVFNTYGPRMSTSDNRAIPIFLRQALAGEPLTVHGKGFQNRTFCYIDDLVDGLILVQNMGRAGEVYNLGSDKQMTVYDLAGEIIKAAKSKSKIKFIERPKHDHQGRKADTSKVSALGWKMKISLSEGLEKTIDYSKLKK